MQINRAGKIISDFQGSERHRQYRIRARKIPCPLGIYGEFKPASVCMRVYLFYFIYLLFCMRLNYFTFIYLLIYFFAFVHIIIPFFYFETNLHM